MSQAPSLVLGLFFAAQEGLNITGMQRLARQAEQGTPHEPAMKCPYCGHLGDKVVDSRESKEGEVIRRRRECLECGKRFTSYERIDEIPYMVVKKDGTRERFERQKLIAGLLKACEKRPVSVAALEAVADQVEAHAAGAAREGDRHRRRRRVRDGGAQEARQGGLRAVRVRCTAISATSASS